MPSSLARYAANWSRGRRSPNASISVRVCSGGGVGVLRQRQVAEARLVLEVERQDARPAAVALGDLARPSPRRAPGRARRSRAARRSIAGRAFRPAPTTWSSLSNLPAAMSTASGAWTNIRMVVHARRRRPGEIRVDGARVELVVVPHLPGAVGRALVVHADENSGAPLGASRRSPSPEVAAAAGLRRCRQQQREREQCPPQHRA